LTAFPALGIFALRETKGASMKKQYTKPVLARREKLSAVTAASASSFCEINPRLPECFN
jgi:hypothetical protein